MFAQQPYYFGFVPQFLNRDEAGQKPFAVQPLAFPCQPITKTLAPASRDRHEVFQILQLLDVDFDLVITPPGELADSPPVEAGGKVWFVIGVLDDLKGEVPSSSDHFIHVVAVRCTDGDAPIPKQPNLGSSVGEELFEQLIPSREMSALELFR